MCMIDYILTKLLTIVSQYLDISREKEVIITIFDIDF